MSSFPATRRALLVDDDPVSLTVLGQMVSKEGWLVDKLKSAQDALSVLLEKKGTRYDAVLTDYHMPGMNGLELVAAVRDIDPALATVLITSDSERGTLSDSLKEGVLDFLEKPVKAEELGAALAKALVHTRDHRRSIENQARLRQVAEIQRKLAPELRLSCEGGLSCSLLARCHPLHEAGGDFLSVFPDKRSSTVHIAMGDISGHGLKEGFIATYFQGMVRGMQSLAAPSLQIARQCNEFLLRDWVAGEDLPCSLSAIFIDLDLAEKKLSVANCGCPGAAIFRAGRPPVAVSAAGSPLGWFEELQAGVVSFGGLDEGHIIFWSDGLVDCASRFGVLPEALAARLLRPGQDEAPSILEAMPLPDDITVAKLDWSPAGQAADFYTVFHARFDGGLGDAIDALLKDLVANLRFALPGIPDPKLGNIDLCAREAVLNAAQHGCGGDPGREADIVVELHNDRGLLVRVIVIDPGPGYDLQNEPLDADILDGSREHVSIGLSLIRNLADTVRREKNGAHIEMDFFLQNT